MESNIIYNFIKCSERYQILKLTTIYNNNNIIIAVYNNNNLKLYKKIYIYHRRAQKMTTDSRPIIHTKHT